MFDKQVRHYIYEHFVKTRQASTLQHSAQAFSCPITNVRATTTRTPNKLLRFSIGLEHPNDLIDELSQALEGAKTW